MQESKATVGDFLDHAMKQPDMSIRTGFAERLEASQAGNLKRIDIDAGFKAIGEALDRRRCYIDEMEKLIGVRSLDQYPNGIGGAVVALLGITNQLETKSRIGWDTFVIGELIKYINDIGTTKEVMDLIMAKRTATIEIMTANISTLAPHPRPMEEVKEFVTKTLKEVWAELKAGPRGLMLNSRDFEMELKDKSEVILYTTPTIADYKFCVTPQYIWKGVTPEMRVVVRIERDEMVHGLTVTL